jgi:hypothetical protein
MDEEASARRVGRRTPSQPSTAVAGSPPPARAAENLPLPDRFHGRPRRGKLDSEQVALYDRFGIEVPFVRIGNPERRYFRISAQLYNSLPQYEYLAECLDRL